MDHLDIRDKKGLLLGRIWPFKDLGSHAVCCALCDPLNPVYLDCAHGLTLATFIFEGHVAVAHQEVTADA